MDTGSDRLKSGKGQTDPHGMRWVMYSLFYETDHVYGPKGSIRLTMHLLYTNATVCMYVDTLRTVWVLFNGSV